MVHSHQVGAFEEDDRRRRSLRAGAQGSWIALGLGHRMQCPSELEVLCRVLVTWKLLGGRPSQV